MHEHIAQWDNPPLISVVMPVYNTDERWLRSAIDSVLGQIYPQWELCIADNASSEPHVSGILKEYAKKYKRIKIKFISENGHISAASNTALEIVTGEFTTLLDHDDVLPPNALFWVAKEIMEHPDAMLIYSDEDKIDEKGKRFAPHFKSDWNPDLFLSYNYITHPGIYRTSIIRKINGFREGYEGAQDYDLILRFTEQINENQIYHIPRVLYHSRVIDGSTAKNNEQKPYALIAAKKAVSEYLTRKNINAEVMSAPELAECIRVKYELPESLPLVSIIIPTRNKMSLLKTCVESIINKTDYTNYEIIIIDNNNDEPKAIAYLNYLENSMSNIRRITYHNDTFNYSDMNNAAIKHCSGDFICFLNNDTEVINKEWLSEMMSHAIRPETGAVSARLWYPDDTLQHGGVIVGPGIAHLHKHMNRNSCGYMGRAALIQNFSAVTGACMVLRKKTFLAVHGFDAVNLKVAFNDVDLCLKIKKTGLRILWTPYAELYHHESATRGYEDNPEKLKRFKKELSFVRRRWKDSLLNDFAYSPNLALTSRQGCSYAWPPRVPSLSKSDMPAFSRPASQTTQIPKL
jgi:glycosyltransferase involved in cell wall biosynthesis